MLLQKALNRLSQRVLVWLNFDLLDTSEKKNRAVVLINQQEFYTWTFREWFQRILIEFNTIKM